jgi:hypothetical protein
MHSPSEWFASAATFEPTLREAGAADLDACARMFCATIRRNLPKSITRQRLGALLATRGVRGFMWLDERCTPIGFAIGRCQHGRFEVLELCVPAESDGLRLLDAVRRVTGAGEVVLPAELSRGRARRFVETL